MQVALELMLPDPDYAPSMAAQSAKVPLIALTSSFDLLSPRLSELVLPAGEPPPMPEVTINEHCDSLSREDNVRLAWQICDVLSEAISSAMKLRTSLSF